MTSKTSTQVASDTKRIALVGNPNAGKTSLFNVLTGLRAKTANYPGVTVDIRVGTLSIGRDRAELVDLPGMYSLDAMSPEEAVATQTLRGELEGAEVPDVLLLVLDATNLTRNLFLASQVLDLQQPTVVALTLFDAAKKAGIQIDVAELEKELKCPIIPVSARTGEGLSELRQSLQKLCSDGLPIVESEHVSCTVGCTGCEFAARYDWAEQTTNATVDAPREHNKRLYRVDRYLTQPAVGVIGFLAIMLGVFYLIFSLADVPMGLIEGAFSWIGDTIGSFIPESPANRVLWMVGVVALSMACFASLFKLSKRKWTRVSTTIAVVTSVLFAVLPLEDFRGLVIDGIIGGVGGVIVFLPQICILFFFIALLEDSGYMARAAFVMERIMRFVGLPGKAFVPMLSAHACAIPGIMAARVIENWRDRLATILVLPLLTCSARLPVYGMVAMLLFGGSPGLAALVFLGAYVLGIAAALLSAFVLKKTILKGETAPMVLELPPYRLPSIRNALMTVFDRAMIFVKRAGTVILAISIVLWMLVTYPKMPEDKMPSDIAAQVTQLRQQADQTEEKTAQTLTAQANSLVAQESLAYSFAGRAGQAVEPIFAPLGFDWKINVGVLSSFAAREVIVSTLAIIYGAGEDAAEDEAVLTEQLRRQRRADGTPVYDRPTCLSLLVFYVLAMQCLPTQAVTRRETGSWKWAIFQLCYMTALAYVSALITYQVAKAFS